MENSYDNQSNPVFSLLRLTTVAGQGFHHHQDFDLIRETHDA